MAYTLSNLQTDIRNYTEVSSTVLTDAIVNTFIVNAENKIYREADSDDNRFYATSTLITGNRYVTIPADLRVIRYIQLKNTNVNPNTQTFLEKKDPSYMATYYDTPSTSRGPYLNTMLIGMLIFGWWHLHLMLNMRLQWLILNNPLV